MSTLFYTKDNSDGDYRFDDVDANNDFNKGLLFHASEGKETELVTGINYVFDAIIEIRKHFSQLFISIKNKSITTITQQSARIEFNLMMVSVQNKLTDAFKKANIKTMEKYMSILETVVGNTQREVLVSKHGTTGTRELPNGKTTVVVDARERIRGYLL